MPARPLLRLPAPERIGIPRGSWGGDKIRFPSPGRQRDRFRPVFNRLRDALNRENGAIELRDDPSSLAPERVIVFEFAGAVSDLQRAAARIRGLEFMAEYEGSFEADEDFAVQDERKGRAGQDRSDKPVPSQLYLAMPDMRALQELLSLWERWERGEPMDSGYTPFAHLFKQLHALRAWGPQDRIPKETVDFWREEMRQNLGRPVRTEIELWYRESADRRQAAARKLSDLVTRTGGQMIHQVVVTDIGYHGALIDIPASEMNNLIEHPDIGLAVFDDILFLRPQSMLADPLDLESEADGAIDGAGGSPTADAPIAALLDGMPVQAHKLLENRLVLDDPDDLQARTIVSRRVHGTAMASLILHGDRNEEQQVLSRPIYVRPVMVANENGIEETERDRLLIDTIHRAVLRIKGSPGEVAAAPSVFLINISLGDPRRPFTRLVSPLARLLDFLASRYNVLFLVSGGNVTGPLDIPDFSNWSTFESAAPADREKAVVKALNAAKHERTILSPAESLNAITIGAQHHDSVAVRQNAAHAVDPFANKALPNVSSGLGLGHRRMIKPELYFPGGREYVRMRSSGNGVSVSVGNPQRLYGLKAAAADVGGQGRLDHTALSDGTSSATALATRSAHRIFDALMDSEGGSLLADMDPEFYAVTVKCLLVHSAKWNGNDAMLKDICGPAGQHRHNERAENSCRFIGFGVPDIGTALECAGNRATLVGYGTIASESAQSYRIPLPECLERVTDPRSLTVTLAWFSPIKPTHRSYRCVRLEADSLHPPLEMLGVKRLKSQPSDASIKRGSVFHEHFHGKAAVPFIEDGHLVLRVWCKEDAGVNEGDLIRYGIAVTVEAEGELPVYDQIQARLRVRPRAGV
jgi:hypothetical protein